MICIDGTLTHTTTIMYIYKILNLVNNKVYIGQTRLGKSRWVNHRAKFNTNSHPNKHLQSAWNKYGEDSFKFEVIEECSTLAELDVCETKWIIEHNATDKRFGYNSTTGGNSGFIMSKEVRKKMSVLKTGFKHSDETKRKISINHSRHSLGKRHSDETKRKISESGKGRIVSAETNEKKRNSMIGKIMPPRTQEYKDRQSQSLREVWSDPEFKAKMSPIRKSQMTDEVKLKISNTKKLQCEKNGPTNVKSWPPLISPDGTVYTDITDMSKFARNHGIVSNCLRRVAHGERKTYRGWKLA